MKSFSIEILTPVKPLFKDSVEMAVVPGSDGYLGILAEHAPLLACLAPGRTKVVKNGREIWFSGGPGFVEVASGKVTVMLDTAEAQPAE